MTGSSSIPPKFVPEGEARMLDPTHPDFDSSLRDAVQNEARLVPEESDENVESGTEPDDAVLIQALGDMVEGKRESSRRCICSASATRSAFQSHPPPENKGFVGDINEDQDVGRDPDEEDALADIGVLDEEAYFGERELAESKARDRDDLIMPPPDDLDADSAEMQAIQAFMAKAKETGNELKVNAIYNTVGIPKNVEEIALIVDRILKAINDDEVLKICNAEGISMEEEDDYERVES
jgi:hypothetical protein